MSMVSTKGVVVRLSITADRQRIVVLDGYVLLMGDVVMINVTMVGVLAHGVSFCFDDSALLFTFSGWLGPARERVLDFVGVLKVDQVVIPNVVNFVGIANVFVPVYGGIQGDREALR